MTICQKKRWLQATTFSFASSFEKNVLLTFNLLRSTQYTSSPVDVDSRHHQSHQNGLSIHHTLFENWADFIFIFCLEKNMKSMYDDNPIPMQSVEKRQYCYYLWYYSYCCVNIGFIVELCALWILCVCMKYEMNGEKSCIFVQSCINV